MKMWNGLLLLALATAAALPTAQAELDPGIVVAEDISGTKVCIENNAECYYVLPPGCISGYDHDDDGVYVGYVCARSPAGACVFEHPGGDGSTCVVLLAYNGAGETCVVNYSGWEYAGYERYVCFN